MSEMSIITLCFMLTFTFYSQNPFYVHICAALAPLFASYPWCPLFFSKQNTVTPCYNTMHSFISIPACPVPNRGGSDLILKQLVQGRDYKIGYDANHRSKIIHSLLLPLHLTKLQSFKKLSIVNVELNL